MIMSKNKPMLNNDVSNSYRNPAQTGTRIQPEIPIPALRRLDDANSL